MARYISQFTGEEIDNRLVSVEEKVGAALYDVSTNTQYLFKTEDDKNAWINGDTSVWHQTCPFEFSGTVNRMVVNNLMPSKNLYYTQKSTDGTIRVSFTSQEKGITDTSWSEVDENAYFKVELDKGVTGSYTTLIDGQLVLNGAEFSYNILPYIAIGDSRVRITATGELTRSSSSIVYSVVKTTMYIAPANFAWNVPFIEGNTYNLGGLYIGGTIDKILKIKVSNEKTYSKTYDINIGTQTNTNIAYYYKGLEFPNEGTGVYSIELWLDANGLESEHLHYNIICVAKADVLTAQLIAVSNVPSTVKNYDTNTLFSYVVYNGGATTANPIVNVSAIINNTPIVIVDDEELKNVATSVINNYTIGLEIDTQETNIQLYSSIELGDSKQEATYDIDNSNAYPAFYGAVFYMNPVNRNNSQGNRITILNESNDALVDKEYAAIWSGVSFTDGMDGWTEDNDGRKCLRLPATSKVEIDYAPFVGAATRTLEISYKVENSANFNDDVITIATDLTSEFIGVRVKPTNVLLHSTVLRTDDLMQGYNTKDEELVHLLVTVIQNYNQIGNLAQIYVNGVKKCSFEWSSNDTFAHSGKVKLGSDTADLYIYKMRVYTFAFDWIMAMQNFISCLPDTTSKDKAYIKMRSVLNDGNMIDFNQVQKNGYNYFVIELPEGKQLPSIISPSEVDGTNIEINIQQNPDFVINGTYTNEKTEGQGTTSMNYFRWNLRWKGMPIRVTAKKNFASSMHSHKMGATALFNDLNRMIVGENEAGGRVAVEQYGAYGFIKELKEGTTDQYVYTSIGLYTIGQDKGDKTTFGYNDERYKSTLIHLEGTDHAPRAVGMDYPWSKLTFSSSVEALGVKNASGIAIAAWEVGACMGLSPDEASDETAVMAALDKEFKPAYECDYKNTSLIVGLEAGTTIDDVNSNLSDFRATSTDNGYTYADCLIWIDGTYNTYYYDVIAEKYLLDDNNILTMLNIDANTLNSMVTAINGASEKEEDQLFPKIEGYTDITVADYKSLIRSMNLNDFSTFSEVDKKNFVIRLLRRREYRETMEKYWHLRDSLFHYCFIVLFAATDNFKKNTYPYKFGTLASDSRWRWRQDDLDTLFDINNQGLANKIYSLLNGDKSGITHLFRGNTSYHWTNIQFYYENDINQMMLEIMDAMASLGEGDSDIEKAIDCIRKYFWDKAQDYFTKSAYNLDAEWSYEAAWEAKINGTYLAPVHPLQQSLGSHYEAERAFVELRLIFMASMYGFGAFAVGNDSDTTLGQISFRPAQGDNTFNLTPAINMNPTILIGDSNAKSANKRLEAGEASDITIYTDGDTSIYIQGTDYLSDIGDFSQINFYAENPQLTVKGKRLRRLKVGDESADNVKSILKSLSILPCPSLSEIDARNVTTLTGTIDLSQCPRLTKAYFGGSSVGEVILPKGSKITLLELPKSIKNISLVMLSNLTEEGLKYEDLEALTYLRVENNAGINGYKLLRDVLDSSAPITSIRVIGFTYSGDASDVAWLSTLAAGGYYGIDSNGQTNYESIPIIEGSLYINSPVYEADIDNIKSAYSEALKITTTGEYYIPFADSHVLSVLLSKNIGDAYGILDEQAAAVTDMSGWFTNNADITSFNELIKFPNVTAMTETFKGATALKEVYFETLPMSSSICQGCTSLEKAMWNDAASVATYAFEGCTNLKEIGSLDSVTEIYSQAFKSCQSLAIDVTLNASFMTLGGEIFMNTGIKSFSAPNLTTNLSYSSFYNCTSLESVNIPKISSLAGSLFRGCTALQTINGNSDDELEWDVKSISDYCFQEAFASAKNLIFPNVTTIGIAAFRSAKIASLTAANTTSVGVSCFAESQSLVSLSLPQVQTIPNNICYQCKSLTSIDVSNATAIGSTSFRGCSSLSGVSLPNVTSIGADAFYLCSNLANIEMPKVKTVDSNAFRNCSLQDLELTLPVLTSVGVYAFGNTRLKTFTAPNLSEFVLNSNGQSYCFSTCTSLTSVTLGTIKSLPPFTFYGCQNLTTLSFTLPIGEDGNYIAPELSGNALSGAQALNAIYVQDEAAVDVLKAATGWIDYADIITYKQ